MQFNTLDIITTVLGLAYILFEYRASAWMWIVGIVMQLLGIVLYYQKGLYADCGMEFYYLSVSFYGLWQWVAKPKQAPKGEKTSNIWSVFSLPSMWPVVWMLSGMVALWMLIYWLLVTFTDSTVPLADSFTTALSLLGVWALAHKMLEQWLVWIVVDVVSSVLYATKGLPFKSGLYALYVVIAVLGYFRWRRLAQMSSKPRM
ncbi:MAG: nicotinamide mononucleotide transporter [Prevotella sp.]|nr:nicotinamide mononucleotide transporter [Prevotella sp.]